MPWPFSVGDHSYSGEQQSRLDDNEPLDVHSWGDKETHIRITNPVGFAVKVSESKRETKEGRKKYFFDRRPSSLVKRSPLTLNLSLSHHRPPPTNKKQVEAHARVDLPYVSRRFQVSISSFVLSRGEEKKREKQTKTKKAFFRFRFPFCLFPFLSRAPTQPGRGLLHPNRPGQPRGLLVDRRRPLPKSLAQQ